MLEIKMWHVMVMVAVLAVWLSLLRVTLGWSSSDRSLHCASNLRNVTLAVLGYVNNPGSVSGGYANRCEAGLRRSSELVRRGIAVAGLSAAV